MEALESLILTPDGRLPIYLQIQHQLRYLITSGQLPFGSRLPTVREVAAHLDVNGSTVSLAYRHLQADGLIDARPGRGTFVIARDDHDTSLVERERLALAAVERALLRNAALGFTGASLLQRASVALQRGTFQRTVVLIGATRRIVMKYAGSIERAFPGTTVVPFEIGALKRVDPVLDAGLEIAYDVVMFASLSREEREAVRERASRHRVLTISGQVTDETIDRLRSVPADRSVCLVAQSGYLNVSMRLLERHMIHHDVESLPTATEDDPERAHRLVREHDVVVFNTGVLEEVPALRVPWRKACELVFDLDAESLAKLGEAWGCGNRGEVVATPQAEERA